MKIPAVLLAVALCICACSGEPAGEAPAAASRAPAAVVPAADPAPVPAGDPRIALAAKMPGVQPSDLRAAPVPGIYEVAHNGTINYVTADASHVFSGDLFQVTADGEFPNLTELRRRELRQQLLAAIPEQEMITFGSARAAHTITVFTDMDCQWCRHMHAEVSTYHKQGIRVRYLAFPRSGPATDSWDKAVAVWCAKDRQSALTTAKQGGTVPAGRCDSPVERHYALGQQVGITGTPGVVLGSGEVVPGYLPAEGMLQAIKDSAAAAAAAAGN
ncbi:MAG TPA: DsbC family protein [Steroidobacteraceae bacterium]|nr:DsbC family protein [Steroidobacteraceae bacterium]